MNGRLKPSALAVLDLLRAHPAGVTALDALYAGCGDRLAARVWELRDAGHDIRDSWEATPNGARIKRYRYCPPVWTPVRGTQSPMFGLDPLPGGVATPLPRASRQGA